tara:strand:- start:8970 stop:10943 length:1974 start_codon:yes stop_codon:yes gene_type:complete
MTIKIIYCAQFKDLTGYGIASRSYLSAIDKFLQSSKINVDFKIYPIDIITNSELEEDYLELIKKYSFTSQDELDSFVKNGDYECIWHCTSILPMFADSRFKRGDNLKPCLKDLIVGSANNHHLVVWETTKISKQWQEAIEYFAPKNIFTACEFNRTVFDGMSEETVVVPHPISDLFAAQNSKSFNLGMNIEDRFKILSMSQWDQRKGFSDLIFSYLSEFDKEEKALLILKTYPSGDFKNKNEMAAEIGRIKKMMDPHRNLPEIILIADFLQEDLIKWLYEISDVYATATKGEGFGLTIFESILNGLPAIVPAEGGHIDYINPHSNYLTSGRFDCVNSTNPAYSPDSEWFQIDYKSLRANLRQAYNDWKAGEIKSKGKDSKNFIIKSENFQLEKVGEKIINKIAENIQKQENKIPTFLSLQEKVNLLKDKHKGETLYILNCGPSLNEYEHNFLRLRLKDETVFSIKQAFNYFPEITDYHFFNCSNLPLANHDYVKRHYDYTKHSPVVIASSNYDLGLRWSAMQKIDLFFKIPIRTEINNEFVSVTGKFEDFCLDNTLTRPCGPGIMYETVFYMAAHMGFKQIVCIGWDLRQSDANNENYEHFYGQTEGLFNRGDVLDWEMDMTTKASKELFYWLKYKGIDLKIASSSATYKGIPRVKL